MEEEFILLQEQIRRSEIRFEGEDALVVSFQYNGFANIGDFDRSLDPYISSFMALLYTTHKQSINLQFDKYNELLRRWRSLGPYFELSDSGRVVGHRRIRIPNGITLERVSRFVRPFIEVQYNTFLKIERELSQRLEFLQHSQSLHTKESRNASVQVLTSYESAYTQPSFVFIDESRIRTFFEILFRNQFIENTDYLTVERNFSGRTVRNKILWTSSRERLNYLIRTLRQNKVIADYKRRKNELIVSCFCDRNGNDFTEKQFSAIHDPHDSDRMDAQFEELWDTEFSD